MECSHRNPQWFCVLDGNARYYAALCSSCNRIGLLGHRSFRSGSDVQAVAAIRWGASVAGPPADAIYVTRQADCPHGTVVNIEPESKASTKRFRKCQDCKLVGTVREDGSVSWGLP